jgi:hypothetical protein
MESALRERLAPAELHHQSGHDLEFLGRLIGEFLCGVRRDDAPALLAPGDHGIGKSAPYEVGAIPLDI